MSAIDLPRLIVIKITPNLVDSLPNQPLILLNDLALRRGQLRVTLQWFSVLTNPRLRASSLDVKVGRAVISATGVMLYAYFALFNDGL